MKIKETLMALAIAVMAALFIGLLIDAVYPPPEYEQYCTQEFRAKVPPGQYPQQCEDPYFTYQQKINQCNLEGGFPEFDFGEDGCQVYTLCNFCQKEFNEANEEYNRNVFYIITPLGLLAIIFGLFYSFEVVGSGIMFSGILLIIYSTGRYFSNMSKVMRVIVIFVELVLLILIATKKMRKKDR